MVLIFGGAYQGKLDYARACFNIDKVSDCAGGAEPDFGADCICNIEEFVMECVKEGVEARDWFEARRSLWDGEEGSGKAQKIFIVTDTSQGVVPIDRDVRAFREMNGRLLLYLSKNAQQVHRVFCGIGKRIK